MARTSVCKDLVVAGGEAFGGQVLYIPVHVRFRCMVLPADYVVCCAHL
jgi:hypothetical protein